MRLLRVVSLISAIVSYISLFDRSLAVQRTNFADFQVYP